MKKIFFTLCLISLPLWAKDTCQECKSLAFNGVKPESSSYGSFSKVAHKVKKHANYQTFCDAMVEGEYRAGFRILRDKHHQRLERDYSLINCSETRGPVFEFAAIGGSIDGVGGMIRYLKLMEKKHHKKYVEPILNYLEPDRPQDLSFLDVLQIEIDKVRKDKGPYLKPFEDFYQRVVQLGAKHSYYYCLKHKIDSKKCLRPQ